MVDREGGVNRESLTSASASAGVIAQIVQETEQEDIVHEGRLRKTTYDTNTYLLVRRISGRDLDGRLSTAAAAEFTAQKPLHCRTPFESTVLTFALRKDVDSASYRIQAEKLVEVCRSFVITAGKTFWTFSHLQTMGNFFFVASVIIIGKCYVLLH